MPEKGWSALAVSAIAAALALGSCAGGDDDGNDTSADLIQETCDNYCQMVLHCPDLELYFSCDECVAAFESDVGEECFEEDLRYLGCQYGYLADNDCDFAGYGDACTDEVDAFNECAGDEEAL